LGPNFFNRVREETIVIAWPCKKKVMLSLCLINQPLCHEDIRGSGCIAPPFLTSAVDGAEWSASCPDRFTPGERAPGTHWIGGWVGPGAGLDAIPTELSRLLKIICRIRIPRRALELKFKGKRLVKRPKIRQFRHVKDEDFSLSMC
jgi:hypothetical protein